MARKLRVDLGGVVYLVQNRRVGRTTLFEYVERSPKRAEQWTRSSLWRRQHAPPRDCLSGLDAWPVEARKDRLGFVNRPETAAELDAIRRGLLHGCAFGQPDWRNRTATRLQLNSSLRPPWRPGKVDRTHAK